VATPVPDPRRLVARRDRNYKSVMRPTRWGNPYPVDEAAGTTRERALALYREWLARRLREDPAFLEPLRGYHLGCTCAPELACHADLLLEALYGPRRRSGRAAPP
jgi:hypothetical protein